MSITYALLEDKQAEHIRKQRLLDLEADHWRFVLDLEELTGLDDPGAGPIMDKLADVARRIAVHRKALGLPEDVHELEKPEPCDAE